MSEHHQNLTQRFNARRPQMLIIHGTEVDWAKTEDILRGRTDYEASCHYAISQAGEVVHYLDESVRAWHAGQGWWGGLTDINSISIGIELELVCPEGKFADPANTYSDIQMEKCIELCRDITTRHNIQNHLVLGHQDTAPYRKVDPGVSFEWARLAAANIGAWHGMTPSSDTEVTDPKRIAEFRMKLAAYGYDARNSDAFEKLVRAFQTHFLPWNISGRVTQQSLEAIDRLLALRDK